MSKAFTFYKIRCASTLTFPWHSVMFVKCFIRLGNSLKDINFLVLQCPSSTGHNITISKVMVFFTGRLKKYNKGLFYSPSGSNSDCDLVSRLRCWSWNWTQAQMMHLKPKLKFKIWIVEVVLFRYEWRETPHLK